MATAAASAPVPAHAAAPPRPVARWIATLDARGRRGLVMRWELPDSGEALPTWLATGSAGSRGTSVPEARRA
jgi:hypothetical protein